MLCRFYLHISSNSNNVTFNGSHEVTSDVVNSSQLEQSWERKDFGGVSRKYGSRIEFAGDAAQMLVDLWNIDYIESKASFSIHVADNHWNFSEAWSCPLDFSTFSWDGRKASISCVDNSAASLIKANGGTKSSYQVSALRSPQPLLYDRVVTRNEAEYMMVGDTVHGEDTWTKVIATGSIDWIIPISLVDTSRMTDRTQFVLQDQGGYFDLPHNVSDDHFAEVNQLTSFWIDFSDFRIKWNTLRTTVARILRFYIVQWPQRYSSLHDAVYNNDFQYLVSDWANIQSSTKTFACSISGNYSVEAGNNLSFVCSFANDSFAGGDEFWMNTNRGEMAWNTRGENVDINVIEPSALLNKVLETVADGKMTMTGEISPNVGGVANARLAGMKIVAAESIRGFDDAYIHTSFNQFAKMMESVFGYVYQISENAGSASVTFLHRSDLFQSSSVKSLTKANGFQKSVDNSMLYAEVKVGFDDQEYENGNTGNDEWNSEYTYLTGNAMKSATLDLVSPYRADCYGIEELVAKSSEKEKTDKDEDVFIVKCNDSVDDGRWRLDRTIAVSGAYTNTVFNAAFTPIYMVEANKGYISSFCNGLKLSMTSGSRDVVVGGEAVTKNFTFSASDRMFRCCELKVTTDDQELPMDKNGVISFEYDGELYSGYLRSVKTRFQSEEPLEYELIEC